MTILIAPQAYKGSLDAVGVAEAIASGIRGVWADASLDILPVADGGEGTVQCLVTATSGRFLRTTVEDPLGRPTEAEWGILGDRHTAVIEMAAASGLPLLRRHERNPMISSTYGTGQLIRAALDEGVDRLIIGIGGSATNDAGAGMAHSLGVRFLDDHGRYLPRGGRALLKLAHIDVSKLDPRLSSVEVIVASDVNNPLVGPEGASQVYGGQKGGSPRDISILDAALGRYADVVARDLGTDVRDVPGAGAAGGLGAGLLIFAGARITSGVNMIFQAMNFDDHLEKANIVFTGEGRIDGQDIYGKAPLVVGQRALKRGIPVIAIVGSIGRGYEAVYDHGISAVLSIVNRPMNIEQAVVRTAPLIEQAAEHAARLIEVGKRL